MYQKYHVYQSEFMKDKSNDHLINHLKKGKNKNILFEFLSSKFEDDTEQNDNLNSKEYGVYKNITKEGDDDDKEEELVFNCEYEINNFLPYYNNVTTTFSNGKDTFDLALCHYISSWSGNGLTFEQFVLHQQTIERNIAVDNNKSESSTDTETIVDLSLVKEFKKNKSKKVLCYISDMSISNSEYSSCDSDDSISSSNNKKPKIIIKGNDY